MQDDKVSLDWILTQGYRSDASPERCRERALLSLSEYVLIEMIKALRPIAAYFVIETGLICSSKISTSRTSYSI